MKYNTFLFSANGKSQNNGITIIPSNNCWIVYLMPFADKGDKHIDDYQQLCINEKLIGIGWRGGFDDDGNIVSEKDAPPQYAMSAIDKMEINDIVITRLRDGKYYIGKISSEKTFCENEDVNDTEGFKEPRFRYIRKVNKWLCFNEHELPSDITGRLSQQRHKTIERIADDRLKLLLIDLYCKKSRDTDFKNIKTPMLKLNKDNFAKSLNYMELEDLVYLYILSKTDENYILYPSSCKISKIKYEFSLHNPKTNETATCQVKNQAKIDINKYTDDVENYSSIWLFSGLGYENEDANMTNSAGKKIIKIINKAKTENEDGLFEFFKDNDKCKHLRARIENYCVFDDNTCDFKCVYIDNSIKAIKDIKSTNIYFKKNKKKIDGFYFNSEFSSFIIRSDAYIENKVTIDKIIATYSS